MPLCRFIPLCAKIDVYVYPTTVFARRKVRRDVTSEVLSASLHSLRNRLGAIPWDISDKCAGTDCLSCFCLNYDELYSRPIHFSRNFIENSVLSEHNSSGRRKLQFAAILFVPYILYKIRVFFFFFFNKNTSLSREICARDARGKYFSMIMSEKKVASHCLPSFIHHLTRVKCMYFSFPV